jgi:peptide/nickel transport system substrate-binding protein
MRNPKPTAALAIVAAGVLALSACVPTPSEVVEGSTVTVAWSQPFSSNNSNTSFGSKSSANSSIFYATNSRFNYLDNSLTLVRDESFGTYELVSESPLTVTYTINDSAQWSDGTPVDAADMLLAWAANSGALNTPDFDAEAFRDFETGQFNDQYPTDVVFFDDVMSAGLDSVSQVPQFDGKTMTLTYDEFFVDWELVFAVGLPAHIVAAKALGLDGDATLAKQALVDAVVNTDQVALAAISSFWNSGFNFTEMPTDTDLIVGSGPYTITDLVADQYVTLEANENYRGDNLPSLEEIVVRFIPDALEAVQALANGQVDIVNPQPTVEITNALAGLDDVTVLRGESSLYEHIDLQFDESKNGTFSNALVRQAFLKTIPRRQIIDTLIVPLNAEAKLRNSQIFVPGAPGYDVSAAKNGMDAFNEVDIAGAQDLLAEAGVGSPKVCILYASNNPRRVSEFALIEASAVQAGFVVEDCSSPEWGSLLGVPGAYDAALFGWQSSSLGVTNSSSIFRSDGLNNYNRYDSPEVDQLLDELDTTLDAARRIEIQIEVDEILMKDFYGLTIFQFPAITAVSDRVANVKPGPLAPSIFWNIWDWRPADSL